MSADSLKNILVIDDSADHRSSLISLFQNICPAAKVEEYDPVDGKPPETYPWGNFDLIMFDYDLGNGENGLEWLRHYKTSGDFPPVVMLTEKDEEELVVKSTRFGAQSFLRKSGVSEQTLQIAIETALEKYTKDSESASTNKIQVHLFNKEKFFESLNSIKKNDVVLLVEIDKFPDLQEQLGIFGTDSFVKYFNELISNTLKNSGCSGQMTRIGDSTTALLIKNNAGIKKIENLAKMLCGTVEKARYMNSDGDEIEFNINIGIFCADKDKPNVNGVLSSVENACRKAKAIHGNSFVIEGVSIPLEESEKQLSKDLIKTINENRVQPLFQSLVLVSSTAHKSFREIYQARVNLLDANDNILEPKKFFPVLEKTNSLKILDRWIIRHCVGELNTLLTKDKNLKLGLLIPLCVQSIIDKDLSDWINKLIEYVKSPGIGKFLIFEIRLNDFMLTSRQAKLQFNKLRVKLNSSIALTSIHDLHALERCLSQEKFDFVIFPPEHTGGNKMSLDQIQKTVNIIKQHEAISVASRIDTGEYLALSATAGVDYVFGHFVQPPMEKLIATEEVEVT